MDRGQQGYLKCYKNLKGLKDSLPIKKARFPRAFFYGRIVKTNLSGWQQKSTSDVRCAFENEINDLYKD